MKIGQKDSRVVQMLWVAMVCYEMLVQEVAPPGHSGSSSVSVFYPTLLFSSSTQVHLRRSHTAIPLPASLVKVFTDTIIS